MVSSQPDRATGVSGSTWLMHHGFSPFETIKLLELRQRYERGAIRQTIPKQRRQFARWLVENGRLSESEPDHEEAEPWRGAAQRHADSQPQSRSETANDQSRERTMANESLHETRIGPIPVRTINATGGPGAARRPQTRSAGPRDWRRQIGSVLLTIGLVILVLAALITMYVPVLVFVV